MNSFLSNEKQIRREIVIEKLLPYIAEISKLKVETIKLSDDIFLDLKITGGDAYQILLFMHHEFETDFTNLDFNKIFGSEGGTPFGFFIDVFKNNIAFFKFIKDAPISNSHANGRVCG